MSLISERDINQFHEQGYFVTDVAFESSELQAMTDEMDRVYTEGIEAAKKTGDAQAVVAAQGQRSYGQFHTRSGVAAEFVQSPIYLEACLKLIGPDADLYWNQAAVKPPMLGKTFSWHQDSGYTETIPLEYITCWTAVGDSDLENGCIWIIPASHNWGLGKHNSEEANEEIYGGLTVEFSDESDAIPVEMQAGQVAVFSSLMFHKSGPNISHNRTRYGFVPQYHVPGVILKRTGQPIGDQFPVLRNSKNV